MKTICVQPAPGGWTVEADLSGGVLCFVRPEDAERKAYQLGRLAASLGQSVQVLVRDERELTIASAVIGPGAAPRLRLVHRSAR
jgi:hypothetical protein